MTKPQIKTLDKLWSDRVRSVGRCEKCGEAKRLTAAHIVSRRHRATRWDLRNGICLCYRCHLCWAHQDPVEFVQWVRETRGDALLYDLQRRSRDINAAKAIDYDELKKHLGGVG